MNSAVKDSIKLRVKRFAEGRGTMRDLDGIYLWLRSHSFGRGAVRDIGNFVAHADERDQGLVWNTASNLAATFIYVAASGKKHELQADDLPMLKRGLLGIFDMDEAASVRDRTRIGQRKARVNLCSALDKLEFSNGELIDNGMTSTERRIVDIYSKLLILRPAFSEETLVSEFVECLNLNGLLANKAHSESIYAQHRLIALHAVERMHLCQLLMDGQLPCRLEAHIGGEEEGWPLSVMCTVDTTRNEVIVGLATTIFTTTCLGPDCFEPEFWNGGATGSMTSPIEITNNWKIALVA
jgi:hypothetical protein